jgi:hypothetical protein
MLTPEQTHAFGEWMGDMQDGGFQTFDDFVVPLGALVGVYLASGPSERTTYRFTHMVMQVPTVLQAMARLVEGRPDDPDVNFDDVEFDLPGQYGDSSIHHHLHKALWDGRPAEDTTITEADWKISNAVGKASYDFMIGFEPLRIRDTGYAALHQLPRSFDIIRRGDVK